MASFVIKSAIIPSLFLSPCAPARPAVLSFLSLSLHLSLSLSLARAFFALYMRWLAFARLSSSSPVRWNASRLRVAHMCSMLYYKGRVCLCISAHVLLCGWKDFARDVVDVRSWDNVAGSGKMVYVIRRVERTRSMSFSHCCTVKKREEKVVWVLFLFKNFVKIIIHIALHYQWSSYSWFNQLITCIRYDW